MPVEWIILILALWLVPPAIAWMSLRKDELSLMNDGLSRRLYWASRNIICRLLPKPNAELKLLSACELRCMNLQSEFRRSMRELDRSVKEENRLLRQLQAAQDKARSLQSGSLKNADRFLVPESDSHKGTEKQNDKAQQTQAKKLADLQLLFHKQRAKTAQWDEQVTQCKSRFMSAYNLKQKCLSDYLSKNLTRRSKALKKKIARANEVWDRAEEAVRAKDLLSTLTDQRSMIRPSIASTQKQTHPAQAAVSKFISTMPVRIEHMMVQLFELAVHLDPSMERAYRRLDKLIMAAKVMTLKSTLEEERLEEFVKRTETTAQNWLAQAHAGRVEVNDQLSEVALDNSRYYAQIADETRTALKAVRKRNFLTSHRLFVAERIAGRLYVLKFLVYGLPDSIVKEILAHYLKLIADARKYVTNLLTGASSETEEDTNKTGCTETKTETEAKTKRETETARERDRERAETDERAVTELQPSLPKSISEKIEALEERCLMSYLRIAKGDMKRLSTTEALRLRQRIKQSSQILEIERLDQLVELEKWPSSSNQAKSESSSESKSLFQIVAEHRQKHWSIQLRVIERSLDVLSVTSELIEIKKGIGSLEVKTAGEAG